MVPEHKIVKHISLMWDSKLMEPVTVIKYTLKYRKRFLFIRYWATFKEYTCGWGECSWDVVYETDEQRLVKRFVCDMTKPIMKVI